MFKVSSASLQTFIDTPNCVLEDRVQYSTVHIPNVFCDDHLQLINCVGIVRIHWVRWTETFYHPVYRWIILRTRNISGTQFVQEIKTHVISSVNPPPRKSCCLWHNVEKCGKARQAADYNIRRMRVTCCIIEATNAHSYYAILIAVHRQQWLRERTSMLRYTYFASLVMCLVCT